MGPLHGVRVIELESLAPAPFGCMILADLGAEVIRVDRPAAPGHPVVQPGDPLARGRRSIRLDLKEPEGVAVLLRLADRADVFVEAFRPAVAERLGFGPEACLERNPRLVYARMTGWGQDGPLAPAAGHDIDYIAVAGTWTRSAGPPSARRTPLNLVGDFGGGGMLLAVGVLAALLERSGPAAARWWTRPWWTGPRCWPRSSTASARPGRGGTSAAATCSTAGRRL